ncbi:DUF6233 domain-containing protein [Streptomyces galilaeus]|uniref:DUF6233 domain-containing protein n=1 Tax=Streptomyces galilaeus TaxID=33899 RepID=UPI0019995B1D|nr:DUF6233 domain-containing protein [Streptomyces galilaeus]GGW80805.1 hypothetical protein GCM10010350_76980 [Streptomyces galilaeus]
MWLVRIDAKIAALQQRQAEAGHGRRDRPQPPEWVVELGIDTGRPPLQVHAGHCYMAGKRRRAVGRDEARRLLTDGLQACTHCRPDAQLDIIDLPRRQHPRTDPAPPDRVKAGPSAWKATGICGG